MKEQLTKNSSVEQKLIKELVSNGIIVQGEQEGSMYVFMLLVDKWKSLSDPAYCITSFKDSNFELETNTYCGKCCVQLKTEISSVNTMLLSPSGSNVWISTVLSQEMNPHHVQYDKKDFKGIYCITCEKNSVVIYKSSIIQNRPKTFIID